ncbi:serine protease [Vibrio galatheae]|uniref:Serine protease n=1 Tax=Vibrio galatheae TaxID=579748 RepID=A0A0F4NLE0_9VIBR|nr:trypsin-like serine protease [Vibrio galatheae]KJY82866.1 serine protease [Vibrio galatheae]
MRVSALLICLLMCSRLSYAIDVTPYVVNGTDANIVDYPSFASLFYRTDSVYSSSSYCGATMINSRYVLTAAHCIYGDEDTMLYTVVTPQLDDESNFLSNQQERAIEFYYPDNYVDSASEYWPNDIAIIKLETPLAVSNYSSLLNTSINNTFSSSDLYKAIGHGLIAGNVSGGTNLLEATLTYVDTATCQAEYGSKITSSQLCFSGAINAGYRNATCQGDSGGPVYWYNGTQYIQIGITSFGPSTCGDASVNVTSVFTDIYDYQSWIARVLSGVETPKAYVTTVNGVRTLATNASGVAVVTSEGESGGGSNGVIILVCLVIILLVRSAGVFLLRIFNPPASHK